MWGIQAYSPLALGRAGLALVDQLYFWPPNTDPALARAVLARNFSTLSSGVGWRVGVWAARAALSSAWRLATVCLWVPPPAPSLCGLFPKLEYAVTHTV